MKERSGKHAKFLRIYDRYTDDVFRAAYRYSQDYYLAEEVTQQVFEQLYMHEDILDSEYLKPWLLCVAKNMVLNSNKRNKYEQTNENIMAQMDQRASDIGADEQYITNLKETEGKQFIGKLMEMLYRKNEIWYLVMSLIYIFDVPQEQVARELELSAQAVRSIVFRARRWLRKKYGTEFNDLN